jgi:DNA gyrase subunit A
MTSGDDEVIISTAEGQAIRFNEKDARPMGRASRGVRGIRLRKGDHVIGMDIVNNDSYMLVISEFGYGKRTKVSQFTPHKRGGVGIRSAVVNKKTGRLVGVRALSGTEEEIIIISSQGQTIRIRLKDIPQLGRATQGVRIMRLNDKDAVASLALVDRIVDGEEETEAATPKATTKAAKPAVKAK